MSAYIIDFNMTGQEHLIKKLCDNLRFQESQSNNSELKKALNDEVHTILSALRQQATVNVEELSREDCTDVLVLQMAESDKRDLIARFMTQEHDEFSTYESADTRKNRLLDFASNGRIVKIIDKY